jgi:hypothetical protein
MSMLTTMRALSAATVVAGLTACSSVEPVAYSGISSSVHLMPNRRDDAAHIPFRYATPVDWQSYSKMVIDPVAIYGGSDNQFGGMSDSDKVELANYMRDRFTEKLANRFVRVADASPNTLRLKLILTGAVTNTPVLATFSRIDLAGGLYNGVQAVRGREGTFTGSVMYAVEIYDAPSNRLLSAFVAKQYPGAFNIGASIGSLAAAKVGIDKGADALAEDLK